MARHPTTGRPRSLSPLALALALTVAGCAGSSPQAPTAPAVDLAGFRAGPASELSIDAVAGDAFDPAAFRELLERSGFVGASQRGSSAGVSGPIRSVDIRVVRFEDAAGAATYLGWLREHADEIVGEVQEEPSLGLADSFLLSHAPGDCCPKAQPIWLAAWRRGADAVWLQVIGPEVERPDVEQIVRHVNAAD